MSPSPVVEYAVHGVWSHRLGVDVVAGLRARFADAPAAVIIDLHGMTDDDAASLPLWLAARRAAAAIRPTVPLALCMPATTVLETRLRRIGAERLPIFTTMPEARAAMAARIPA
ncbi:hypothetical protein [Actinoplanes palleronii]|uniref:STAS domain-containing protein n=1 Tax=Actinoplanes palleronii TaxID=113570 RepID=A0ABQ4BPC8_9ACTN|nr:hypothetical protein [Actinoplanes palleronii]GIE72525.1 hypothetical protein Apa02nite_086330 [Actinoplanes palleronii]